MAEKKEKELKEEVRLTDLERIIDRSVITATSVAKF